jgi:hypothetical protein
MRVAAMKGSYWHLLILIAMAAKILNAQLTDLLRKYVDERASDKDVYATPSEYLRDLIRQDMQVEGLSARGALRSYGEGGSGPV